MADNGGEPADRPEARGAKRQHQVSSVLELWPPEQALASTILADKCAM